MRTSIAGAVLLLGSLAGCPDATTGDGTNGATSNPSGTGGSGAGSDAGQTSEDGGGVGRYDDPNSTFDKSTFGP